MRNEGLLPSSDRRSLHLQQMVHAMRGLGFYEWKMGLLQMCKPYFYAVLAIGALSGFAQAANQVSVNFTDTVLEADFLANATAQYIGTVSKSAFFANTYTFNVTGKNPAYQPPPPLGPGVSTTTPYEYGWADGIDYGRMESENRITGYVLNCSTPAYFGASTTSWSAGTCGTSLMAAETDIYNLQFSTPPVLK